MRFSPSAGPHATRGGSSLLSVLGERRNSSRRWISETGWRGDITSLVNSGFIPSPRAASRSGDSSRSGISHRTLALMTRRSRARAAARGVDVPERMLSNGSRGSPATPFLRGASPPPGEQASPQLPPTTPPAPTVLVALVTISKFPACRFCAFPARLAEPSPRDKQTDKGTVRVLLSANWLCVGGKLASRWGAVALDHRPLNSAGPVTA